MKLSLLNRAVVAELVAKSCQDLEFRKTFIADPMRCLQAAGADCDGNPVLAVARASCPCPNMGGTPMPRSQSDPEPFLPEPRTPPPETSTLHPPPQILSPEPRILVHENTPSLLHIVLPPLDESGLTLPFIEAPLDAGRGLLPLVGRALCDAAFRRRFLADPMGCATEEENSKLETRNWGNGSSPEPWTPNTLLPPSTLHPPPKSLNPVPRIIVLEDSEDALHIILPLFPEPAALGAEDLRRVAGGAYVATYDSSMVSNNIGNYSFSQSAATQATFLFAASIQTAMQQQVQYTNLSVSGSQAQAVATWVDTVQELYIQSAAAASAHAASSAANSSTSQVSMNTNIYAQTQAAVEMEVGVGFAAAAVAAVVMT